MSSKLCCENEESKVEIPIKINGPPHVSADATGSDSSFSSDLVSFSFPEIQHLGYVQAASESEI